MKTKFRPPLQILSFFVFLLETVSLVLFTQIQWAYQYHFYSDFTVRMIAGTVLGVVLGILFYFLLNVFLSKITAEEQKNNLPGQIAFLHAPFLFLWLFNFQFQVLNAVLLPAVLLLYLFLFVRFCGKVVIPQKLDGFENNLFSKIKPWFTSGEKKAKILKRSIIGILIFLLVYSTGALFLSHFNLNTSAFDYGIHAGVSRNIIFHGNYFSEAQNMNYLGDHFSPIAAVAGLFFLIWDNAAVVLIVQAILMVLSVFIAFKLAKKITRNTNLALVLSLYLALNQYLQMINNFPYHTEVFGLPLLFLTIYWMERECGSKTLLLLMALIGLTVKEDVPLTMAVFGLWAVFFKKGKRREGMVVFLVSAAGFLIIARYIMPYFSGGDYTHLSRYNNLGGSVGEIIHNIFFNPVLILKNINFKDLFALVFSFGFLPAMAPVTLMSGFAPYFYNSVSSFWFQSSFSFQYSYTALPFIFYAAAKGINNLFYPAELVERFITKQAFKMLRIVLLFLLVFSVLADTVFKIKTVWIPYYSANYLQIPKVMEKYSEFKKSVLNPIPKSASVYSVSELQPHFIGWGYAGLLSEVKPEELPAGTYAAVTKAVPWPWNGGNESAYTSMIDNFRKNWTLISESSRFIVFKK